MYISCRYASKAIKLAKSTTECIIEYLEYGLYYYSVDSESMQPNSKVLMTYNFHNDLKNVSHHCKQVQGINQTSRI